MASSASRPRASSLAGRWLGVPYVQGSSDPETGLDCLGVVRLACAELGLPDPLLERDAWTSVGTDPLQALPGDIVETAFDGERGVLIRLPGARAQFLSAFRGHGVRVVGSAHIADVRGVYRAGVRR